eukprot:GILJ01012474.1.p1 GENE.GILJ01012474.1~~GILJ01012474.1.p1  ORF type:complete len:1299 (+),score=278.64 GILJ01012474.1:509-4405(+)
MTSKMGVLRADADSREAARKHLENEVKSLREMVNKNSSSVHQERQEFDSRIAEMNQQLKERDNTIQRLQTQQQSSRMLETKVLDLEHRVRLLQHENMSLQGLHAQAESVPALESQLIQLENQLRDHQRLLQEERNEKLNAVEEKVRAQLLSEELQQHMDKMVATMSGPGSIQAELHDRKMYIESLSRELNQNRETIQLQTEEINNLKNANSNFESRLRVVASDLSEDLNQLHWNLQLSLQENENLNIKTAAAGSGAQATQPLRSSVTESNGLLSPISLNNPKTSAWVMFDSIQMGVTLLKSKLGHLLTDLTTIRMDYLATQSDSSRLHANLQLAENDKTQLQRDVTSLRAKLQETENQLATVTTDGRESSIQLECTVKQVNDMTNKLQSYALYLSSVYNKALDVSADLKDVAGMDISGLVSRPLTSLETLQNLLSGQLDQVFTDLTQVRSKLADSQSSVTSVEQQLNESRNALEQQKRHAKEEKAQLEQRFIAEQEAMRTAFEAHTSQIMTESTSLQDELHDKLRVAHSELSQTRIELEASKRQADILVDKLDHNSYRSQRFVSSAQFLLRIIVSVLRSNQELIQQKAFLLKRSRDYEILQLDIMDLVHALSGSLNSSQHSKPKLTFRVAVIAVLTAVRFRRFANDRSDVLQLSDAKILLVKPFGQPSNNIVDDMLAGLSAENEPSEHRADVFRNILERLVGDGSHLVSMENLLSRGIRERQWIRQQIKHKSTPVAGPVLAESDGIALIRKSILLVTKQLKEAEHRNLELVQRCQSLEQSVREALDHEQTIRFSMIKSEEMVKFLEGRIADLQKESMTLIAPDRYELAQKQQFEASERIAQLIATQQTLEENLQRTRSNLSRAEQAVQSQQEALSLRKQEIDELKRNLNAKETDNQHLNQQLKHAFEELSNATNQKRQMTERLLQMDTTVAGVSHENANLRQQIRDLQRTESELRLSTQRDSQTVSELQIYLKDIESSVTRLESELSEKERELKLVRDAHLSSTQAYQELLNRCNGLEKQLELSRVHTGNLRRELDRFIQRESDEIRPVHFSPERVSRPLSASSTVDRPMSTSMSHHRSSMPMKSDEIIEKIRSSSTNIPISKATPPRKTPSSSATAATVTAVSHSITTPKSSKRAPLKRPETVAAATPTTVSVSQSVPVDSQPPTPKILRSSLKSSDSSSLISSLPHPSSLSFPAPLPPFIIPTSSTASVSVAGSVPGSTHTTHGTGSSKVNGFTTVSSGHSMYHTNISSSASSFSSSPVRPSSFTPRFVIDDNLFVSSSNAPASAASQQNGRIGRS